MDGINAEYVCASGCVNYSKWNKIGWKEHLIRKIAERGSDGACEMHQVNEYSK